MSACLFYDFSMVSSTVLTLLARSRSLALGTGPAIARAKSAGMKTPERYIVEEVIGLKRVWYKCLRLVRYGQLNGLL